MSTLPVEDVLREQIEILERQVADLERHNQQLRDAVDALLQPASSELLAKNMAAPARRDATKSVKRSSTLVILATVKSLISRNA